MAFKKPKQEFIERKKISDYTTDQLKEIIGEFEQTYAKNCIGQIVSNRILGHVPEGIVKFALEYGAIIMRDGDYFIKYPRFEKWNEAYMAMKELQSRRLYAQKMQDKELDKESREKEDEINIDEIPF